MTPATTFPATITRGDTLLVEGSGGLYPTPDYTYSFAGVVNATGQSVAASNASANSGGWLLNISTAAWPTGSLSWVLRATDGTNTTTIQSGAMLVSAAPGDGSTVNTSRQIVQALDAAILARVRGDEPSSYSVEGMSITKMSITEMRQLRDAYLVKAQQEESSGRGNFKRILAIHR